MRYNKNSIAICCKFTPGGDNKQFGTKILPSLPFDITHVKKENTMIVIPEEWSGIRRPLGAFSRKQR